MKNIYLLLILLVLFSCQQEQSESVKQSTAHENVYVLEPLTMHGLNRPRTIRLYLPPSYESTTKYYPVIYAHDGQNLFDDSTSYVGEWGLDESLNQLAAQTGFEAIVVGIDNGQEKRIAELSPWENKEYGPAEGVQYMDFIKNQLKPHIDSTYRTLPGKGNTVIMGSSLGGLISHYAIFQYPDVFGKAILLSPSYWYADEVWDFTTSHPLPAETGIWLEIGAREGDAVKNVNKMYELILATGHPEEHISKRVDPDGEHNEASWKKQFTPAVKWLFKIE